MKIKDVKLKILFLKSMFKLEKLVIEKNIKKANVIRKVIIQKLQIYLNDNYSEDTFNENLKVAMDAVSKTLYEEEIEETEKTLKAISILENEIENFITDYYLAMSYSYSQAKISNVFKLSQNKDIEEDFYNKALNYNAQVKKFDDKSFKDKIKSVNKEEKKLRKRIKNDLKEKVRNAKFTLISPISISSTHITMILSMFSTLFLISGYYFNYQILKSFDINSDDFYTVQDYISTSISLIFMPFLYTAFYLLLSLLRINDDIYKEIEGEELGLKTKVVNIPLTVILIFLILNIINLVSIYNGGEGSDKTFYLNILIGGVLILNKLPWNYFEKPTASFLFTTMVFSYFVHFNIKIDDKVKNYKSIDYKSDYTISFKDKRISTKDVEFMRVNSNYVFLINKKTNKAEIYPRLSINKIEVN